MITKINDKETIWSFPSTSYFQLLHQLSMQQNQQDNSIVNTYKKEKKKQFIPTNQSKPSVPHCETLQLHSKLI